MTGRRRSFWNADDFGAIFDLRWPTSRKRTSSLNGLATSGTRLQSGGKVIWVIGGHEDKRNVATPQNCDDIVDPSTVDIDVEQRAVQHLVIGQFPGFIERPDGADNLNVVAHVQ